MQKALFRLAWKYFAEYMCASTWEKLPDMGTTSSKDLLRHCFFKIDAKIHLHRARDSAVIKKLLPLTKIVYIFAFGIVMSILT